MFSATQTLFCLSGTALGAILPLYLIFHPHLSDPGRQRLLKAMLYSALLGIVSLWWIEPNFQLQLAGVFWLATILAVAAYFYARPRVHPVPGAITGVLGMIMVYRSGNVILPVESDFLVLVMNLLSGLVLTVFLVAALSSEQDGHAPTRGLWLLAALFLFGRLIWDGYQLSGGKTESRFGLAEEIHTFFNTSDWWLIGLGMILAIGFPLLATLVIPYSRWGQNKSGYLSRTGFFTLLAGHGALVYFCFQYGIVF